MSTSAAIRQISHSEILGAVNAQELIDEYAAECSIPDYDPQRETYAAMENAGFFQCFGAYVGEELVGFASVLVSVNPHHGKRVATIESLFVRPSHRSSGAGNQLLNAAERHAYNANAVALTYTARIGSALEKVLSRRTDCFPSHTVFTRWL